jgi:hypothetical protein
MALQPQGVPNFLPGLVRFRVAFQEARVCARAFVFCWLLCVRAAMVARPAARMHVSSAVCECKRPAAPVCARRRLSCHTAWHATSV